MSLRRRRKSIPQRVPILVVCEGHLEASYFSALRSHPKVRENWAVVVECSRGGKAPGVYKEACTHLSQSSTFSGTHLSAVTSC